LISMQDVCPFTESMYLVKDGHPNLSGYHNLAMCMAGLIEGKSVGTQSATD
jgi:hypothetical protein